MSDIIYSFACAIYIFQINSEAGTHSLPKTSNIDHFKYCRLLATLQLSRRMENCIPGGGMTADRLLFFKDGSSTI